MRQRCDQNSEKRLKILVGSSITMGFLPLSFVVSAFWMLMFLPTRHSFSLVRSQFRRRRCCHANQPQLQPSQRVASRSLIRLLAGARSKKTSTDEPAATALEWERFDYGSSPKWDARFESSRTIIANNEEDLQVIATEEALIDATTMNEQNQQVAAWEALSPEAVQKATNILLPYVRNDRLERIQAVLKQRTIHTSFLFECPSNPSNVFACLRTIESFGIQHVHVIIQSGRYQGKAALSQKRGMRTAMGAAQWLTLHQHASPEAAMAAIRRTHNNNVRIYASDVNADAKDIRTMDWRSTPQDNNKDAADHRICIVMGNEERGISDELRALVDETFYLPMQGFAESFNLSVATAITLAHLSAASKDDSNSGPLRPGDMPQHEYDCQVLKGLLNSIAQKKVAYQLLKQAGVDLPQEVLQRL
jgi:tRNA (guanosine-2'-O-)-methyltransferase